MGAISEVWKFLKRNGGDDGVRTRDLRRDKPQAPQPMMRNALHFQDIAAMVTVTFRNCYSTCYSPGIAPQRVRRLVRRFQLAEFLGVDAVFGAAGRILITEESRPADEVDAQAIQIPVGAIIPCILETHTGN